MHNLFTQDEVWSDHRAYGRWVTISKKTAGPGRQPTGLRCLIKMDAVPSVVREPSGLEPDSRKDKE